jgi:hypothetical protein
MTAKIAKDLKKLARPIDTLSADPENARTHDRDDLESLAASLARFGQQKPIVALTNGMVIAGNGTLEAARSLGWDSLAVVTFENEKDARAFAIADNRTAELSRWNDTILARALSDIRGIDEDAFKSTGFSAEQFDALVDRTFLDGVTAAAKSDAQIEKALAAPAPKPAEPTRDPVASVQSFTFTVVLLSDQHATIVRAIEKSRGSNKSKAVSDCLVEIASRYLE